MVFLLYQQKNHLFFCVFSRAYYRAANISVLKCNETPQAPGQSVGRDLDWLKSYIPLQWLTQGILGTQEFTHVPVRLFLNASVCASACGRLLCVCVVCSVCKLSEDSLCPRFPWVTIERTQELLFYSEPTEASVPSPSALSLYRDLSIYTYICLHLFTAQALYHCCTFLPTDLKAISVSTG